MALKLYSTADWPTTFRYTRPSNGPHRRSFVVRSKLFLNAQVRSQRSASGRMTVPFPAKTDPRSAVFSTCITDAV